MRDNNTENDKVVLSKPLIEFLQLSQGSFDSSSDSFRNNASLTGYKHVLEQTEEKYCGCTPQKVAEAVLECDSQTSTPSSPSATHLTSDWNVDNPHDQPVSSVLSDSNNLIADQERTKISHFQKMTPLFQSSTSKILLDVNKISFFSYEHLLGNIKPSSARMITDYQEYYYNNTSLRDSQNGSGTTRQVFIGQFFKEIVECPSLIKAILEKIIAPSLEIEINVLSIRYIQYRAAVTNENTCITYAMLQLTEEAYHKLIQTWELPTDQHVCIVCTPEGIYVARDNTGASVLLNRVQKYNEEAKLQGRLCLPSSGISIEMTIDDKNNNNNPSSLPQLWPAQSVPTPRVAPPA